MPAESRPSILVVEDDPASRGIISAALGVENRIIAAPNGMEALEIIAEEKPDLLLLDIGLPDLNGLEVCRRLKADSRTAAIPVIFLTALASASNQLRGLRVGGIDYITKPIDLIVVRARVRAHLNFKKHHDSLKRAARIDELTGVASRFAFEEALEREWRRAARARTVLSCIIIDVDHFKKFNEVYGHDAGDDCLRRVADAARDSLQRPADMVARYGGEEFAVLLPETELQGTLAVAESIRHAAQSLAISYQSSKLAPRITVSLGAVAIVPTEEFLPSALLGMAETQLYYAKMRGRNRVIGVTVL